MAKNDNQTNKTLKLIIYIVVATAIIVVSALYITSEKFRDVIDETILKRSVSQNNLPDIEISSENIQGIYAYDKYITILSRNVLTSYNSSGKEVSKIDVNMSNPIMTSDGKYLAMAEKNGKKIYLITGSNILWQNDIDGSIAKISVNKNGYVTVIITNSTYKSIIITYNPSGKELFRKFLSTTYALCAQISNDNKYLAIGEINYTGTTMKSNVEIVSMELAQSKPEESTVYEYNAEDGQIIIDLKCMDKDSVICMFNDYVQLIKSNDNQRLTDIDPETLFCNINLKNNIAKLEKQNSNLLSYEYELQIINTNTNSQNMYLIEGMPKNIKVIDNVIILNFGSEVQIINTSGWLLKKYTSVYEIKDIIASDNIVGIVYQDKIEIISI